MAQPADVFISYSSKDVERAKELQKVLEDAGLKVWRDKPELEAGEHVGTAIPKALRAAEAVAVIWSEHSAASPWVRFEASYAAVEGKIACLHVDGFSPGALDGVLRDYHSEPLAETLADARKFLGRLKKIEDGQRPAPADRLIDISRLPQTFSPELFGRAGEMAQLFEAWQNPHSHIVALDAIGGAGKTALVRHFIQMLEEGGWRGAQRVFVWSFYSQGTDENRQGDADPFYIAALTFFGFEREAAEAEAHNAAGRAPTQKEIADAQRALIRRELPSPAEKGRALARLVRERRTLLFLDGLEPLQYPAGRNSGGKQDSAGMFGALKDKGMFVLLRDLALDNPGLVIVTTRIKLKDLQEFRAPAVLSIPLTALGETPAIELLKARGVTGSEKHLAKLAADLRGHALALNLVARYLVTHHGGDARRADLIPGLVHVGGDDERDPYRVMHAYEIEFTKEIERQLGRWSHKWLRRLKLAKLFKLDRFKLSKEALSTAAGKQLALLYMLGLFDQPVPREVFDALIAPPNIPGLTDGIAAAEVRAAQWNGAIARLREQGLISPASADAPGTLDCHPLVREYFGQRLAQIDRTAFKAAHSRLYDHYRYAGLPAAFCEPVAYSLLCIKANFPNASTEQAMQGILSGQLTTENTPQFPKAVFDASPDQLRKAAALIGGPQWERALAALLPADEVGMMPLFVAITHGCAAEREEEVFLEVYGPRILRGQKDFAGAQLGLYGQDLAALASFFETPFTAPSPRLAAGHRALVLAFTDFCLRALGRLEDAAAPLHVPDESCKALEVWYEASRQACNRSELLVTLGRISGKEGAVAAGEAAVSFANRSSDASMRMIMRTAQADALLQAGALARAGALFREAEAMQKEMQPSLPRLYSVQGSHYCDLLLARSRAAEATTHADWALNMYKARHHDRMLDTALDTLTQARAALAAIPPSEPAPQDCATRFTEALAALRRANTEDHLPPGLLAHAEALWRCGDADAAAEPLHEAEDIAALGPMPLFMTQAHLLRARIALGQGDFAAAREKRDAAAALIAKHDYGRGAVELAVLDAELAIAANGAHADKAIAAALTAVAGEPYHDARTGRTISGGWFGLLPRLEAILPPSHAGLARVQAARAAYNAERDDYLRSTLAKDVEGYDPASDPIAAYLASR